MTLRWSITCSVNRKVSTLAQDLNDGGEQGTFLEFVQTYLFPNTFPTDSGRFGLKIYCCCLRSLNGEIKRLRTKLPQPSPLKTTFSSPDFPKLDLNLSPLLNFEMHSKSLSLFASWHDCRSGGPDVWYITRTWLIIGDGLHQGGGGLQWWRLDQR